MSFNYKCQILIISIYLFGAFLNANCENTSYSWKPFTPFSSMRQFQTAINQFNCGTKTKDRLRLPYGTVSQLPKFNKIPETLFFPNRTGLLHLHNMALNRAFFFSYTHQYFNASDVDFKYMPGLLYHYLSVAADISANPKLINGSTLMYDIKTFYPNWFVNLRFNTTVNLFAIRGIRSEDTFDGDNLLREPTRSTIQVFDMGAQDANYTTKWYRNAPWYGQGSDDPQFLPDDFKSEVTGGKKHIFKFTIHLDPKRKFSRDFFGPPYAGQMESEFLPVKFTKPWFDCGKDNRALNEWLVSSVSPAIDFMPRYAKYKHLQAPKYIAIAAMDTYFIQIPVNLCPISVGNPRPNLLAGSDLCHKSTTICEALYDPSLPSQFLPDLFECRCKPQYSDAFYQHIGFIGTTIGSYTTKSEYESDSYRCERIGNLMFWPTQQHITPHGSSAKDLRIRYTRRRRSVDKEDEEELAAQVEKWEQEQELYKEKEAWVKINATLRAEGMLNSIPTGQGASQRPNLISRYHGPTRKKHQKLMSRLKLTSSVTTKKRHHKVSRHVQNAEGNKTSEFRGDSKGYEFVRFDANWLMNTVPRNKRAVDSNMTKTKNDSTKQEVTSSPPVATQQPPPPITTKHPFERILYNYTGPSILKTAIFKPNLSPFERARRLVAHVKAVQPGICKDFHSEDLVLPGTVSYGVDTQFHHQASTALRLAHFLSGFLQTVGDRNNIVASLRFGQFLHEQHIMGEVMANVAGDSEIVSSGVLFRSDFFIDSRGNRRSEFGPTAYRAESLAAESFSARDLAGFGGYYHLPWYRALHDRWATNTYGLDKFLVKAWIRPNAEAKHLLRYYRFPVHYYAPSIKDGYWSRPYFDCHGPVPDWLVTYAAPFFSKSKVGDRIRFAGVVTVSVRLRRLNINQCDAKFDSENFFRDSNMCDQRTTDCKLTWGMGFSLGNYECHCGHNTEFPFKGERYFYLGSLMEQQYVNKLSDKPNFYDMLHCREGAGNHIRPLSAWSLFACAILALMTFTRLVWPFDN